MEDVKSLYEVRPIKPIVIPEKGVSMRRPASLLLTKEEVKVFMQYGPVYRRINNDVVRVTLANLDEIHGDQENEKPVEIKDDVLINSKPVEAAPAPTPIVEAPKPVPEEPKVVEEKKEEPKKEEPKPEVKETKVEEKVEVKPVEEKKEEAAAITDVAKNDDKVVIIKHELTPEEEKKYNDAKNKMAEDLAPVIDKALEIQKKEEAKEEEEVKEEPKPQQNNPKPPIQINTKNNNHGFHDKNQ